MISKPLDILYVDNIYTSPSQHILPSNLTYSLHMRHSHQPKISQSSPAISQSKPSIQSSSSISHCSKPSLDFWIPICPSLSLSLSLGFLSHLNSYPMHSLTSFTFLLLLFRSSKSTLQNCSPSLSHGCYTQRL